MQKKSTIYKQNPFSVATPLGRIPKLARHQSSHRNCRRSVWCSHVAFPWHDHGTHQNVLAADENFLPMAFPNFQPPPATSHPARGGMGLCCCAVCCPPLNAAWERHVENVHCNEKPKTSKSCNLSRISKTKNPTCHFVCNGGKYDSRT